MEHPVLIGTGKLEGGHSRIRMRRINWGCAKGGIRIGIRYKHRQHHQYPMPHQPGSAHIPGPTQIYASKTPGTDLSKPIGDCGIEE